MQIFVVRCPSAFGINVWNGAAAPDFFGRRRPASMRRHRIFGRRRPASMWFGMELDKVGCGVGVEKIEPKSAGLCAAPWAGGPGLGGR